MFPWKALPFSRETHGGNAPRGRGLHRKKECRGRFPAPVGTGERRMLNRIPFPPEPVEYAEKHKNMGESLWHGVSDGRNCMIICRKGLKNVNERADFFR